MEQTIEWFYKSSPEQLLIGFIMLACVIRLIYEILTDKF
jgi:flagellar biosynthesis protein FliR